MKNKLITLAASITVLLLFTNCYNAQTPANAADLNAGEATMHETIQLAALANTTMEFDKQLHDFNVIPQNQPVHATFKVTNTGTEPLIINSVKPSCSCSVGNWPKEPIAVGETEEIEVTFNAKAQGPFTKTFTVASNAENSKTILKIKGKVESVTAKT